MRCLSADADDVFDVFAGLAALRQCLLAVEAFRVPCTLRFCTRGWGATVLMPIGVARVLHHLSVVGRTLCVRSRSFAVVAMLGRRLLMTMSQLVWLWGFKLYTPSLPLLVDDGFLLRGTCRASLWSRLCAGAGPFLVVRT